LYENLNLPTDTTANKLIVSIHAYTPYDFCYPYNQSQTPNWSNSNSSDTSAIQSAIQPAYDKFVSKGIPVIIGEFGSVNKNNNTAAREIKDTLRPRRVSDTTS
jgi:endoglucanase